MAERVTELCAAGELVASPPAAVARLRALGVHRLVVPIPFEEEGPVNVFVIENAPALGGVTLFDTGVNTPEGQAALLDGLAGLGLRAADVRRVILSHGHIDHGGNAHLFPEAELWAHPEEAGLMSGLGAWERTLLEPWQTFLKTLGLDEAEVAQQLNGLQRFQAMVTPATASGALADGQRFQFDRFEAEILHVPGHTQGICVLFAEAEGLLFSGDHLLEHTSPNPVMEPTGPGGARRPALVSYQRQLRRVQALEIEWVLPGHGPLWTGHSAHIDRLCTFYQRRQRKIAQVMEREGVETVAEISAAVFGGAYKRAPFLVLSEVLGNLEVLEADGRADVQRDSSGYDRWIVV